MAWSYQYSPHVRMTSDGLSTVQVWRRRVHKGAGLDDRRAVYPDLAFLALPSFVRDAYIRRQAISPCMPRLLLHLVYGCGVYRAEDHV